MSRMNKGEGREGKNERRKKGMSERRK